MKYTIHINQDVLSKTNLDIIDSAILDFLIFFCNSPSPKIENKRKDGWTWIDYNQILKQMPLLRLKSKGSITPRIKKIESNGFITTKQIGRRLFMKLNEKVDQLFIKMNDTVQLDEWNRSASRTHKDNKDKDNKDKQTEASSVKFNPLGSEIIKEFTNINPACKKMYGNTSQRQACDDLIENYGLEKVLQVITLLPKTNKLNYLPSITTPHQLNIKWVQLESGLCRLKSKQPQII